MDIATITQHIGEFVREGKIPQKTASLYLDGLQSCYEPESYKNITLDELLEDVRIMEDVLREELL